MNAKDDTALYKVVVNHEEQYSISPNGADNPPEWHDVGKVGSMKDCFEYLEDVWTGMRPTSVRRKRERRTLVH